MAKKKRNKKYQGRDAAQQGPVIKKFEVDDSFNFKQWREEHKLQLIGWVFRGVVGVIVAAAGYGIYLLLT